MAKRVFYLSSGRLCAYTWERGSMDQPHWFEADENGLGEFSSYLENSENDPVLVLTDLVEEEFREDTIPHVIGGDRRALVGTKLARLFRDTTYSHGVFQGREETGRRDDKMLFTALLRPDLLAPWISSMSTHRVPIVGVYSLALITELLFKALKIDNPNALLVTAQTGGLRQTFFKNKQVKISRLALIPDIEPDRYASFLLSEVEKVRRYLTSLRHLPHDMPLDVYVLGDSAQLGDIERQSPDSLTTKHNLISLEEAGKAVGIKEPFQGHFCDAIFAHLLAKKSPPNQYAPDSITKYYGLHRTRIGLIAASVLLLISGVSFSGINFVEGIIAEREAAWSKRQAGFYNNRYRVARERLPATPVESQQVKVAVEIAETLKAAKSDPEKMMITLSRALGRYPQLRLERMAWRTSTNIDAPVGDVRVAATARRLPGAQSVLAEQQQENAPPMLYQLAYIQGNITSFDGNYRRALDLVNAFAEALRAEPGVSQVRIQSLPLDVGSNSSLRGDAVGTTTAREASFELRIALEDKSGEAG